VKRGGTDNTEPEISIESQKRKETVIASIRNVGNDSIACEVEAGFLRRLMEKKNAFKKGWGGEGKVFRALE